SCRQFPAANVTDTERRQRCDPERRRPREHSAQVSEHHRRAARQHPDTRPYPEAEYREEQGSVGGDDQRRRKFSDQVLKARSSLVTPEPATVRPRRLHAVETLPRRRLAPEALFVVRAAFSGVHRFLWERAERSRAWRCTRWIAHDDAVWRLPALDPLIESSDGVEDVRSLATRTVGHARHHEEPHARSGFLR